MRSGHLPTALALLALLALGYAGQRAAQPPADSIRLLPLPCDLNRGPCRATFEQRSLSLDITPRPLPLLRPLDIAVQLDGIAAHSVTLDFFGADMPMGPNSRALERAATGLYRGQGSLPVCVTGRMRWHADVHIRDAQGQRFSARFEFATQ